MNGASLEARAAFSGIFTSPSGRALVATERDGLGLASLSVRRGRRAALVQRMNTHFGIELPDAARRITAAAVAVAGIGPDRWLVSCDNAGNAFSATLKSAVGDAASVVDQSDAYAVIRLSGAPLRETLAKLVPIDLHARAFGVGCVAGTLLGHIGALLWRLADGIHGEPMFEIAVDRSLAASLWHELSQHAAELAG